MIKIIASMHVKEESIAEFQALAEELVAKSAAEEGNVSYTLNQSIKNPSSHCFIELWRDQAAIDEHNASEHFKRILPQLVALTVEAPVAELFTEVEW